MRPIYFIVFAFISFSCKDQKSDARSGILSTQKETANFYKPDTTESSQNLFYPVFQLSPKTTAFVINFSENGNKGLLDSIFDQTLHADSGRSICSMPDCQIYDSSGTYDLMKSEKLESAIRKHYDKEFYIYGTQGKTKASVQAVIFGLDECRTNIFAFCLDNSDLTSIGHPIFCSTKNIDLQYSNNYGDIEKTIGTYLSKTPADYDDSIKLKVMGNAGNFYFTYNDDFLWGQKLKEAKCKFPARCIYTIDKNNNVSRYWSEGLDLFGIGCD